MPSSAPTVTPHQRVLELHDIRVSFDGHEALRGVDLDAARGEILAVVGANGSGKSTLLAVSAGLLAPTSGTVRRPAGTRVGLVPQSTNDGARLPLTVTDLVTMGRWRERGPFLPLRRSDRARVAEAIETVGLTALARRPLGVLSGGQRQRAYLAQALAQDADLLLLDEPMSGLDAASREAAASALSTVARAGVAVIVVTHDLAELGTVDAVCRLVDGHIADASTESADRAPLAGFSDASRGREHGSAASVRA
ncbi:zinc ABC transporter ATP-binding protein AztA [Microbacterium thalli]|uniref:zinc ABC transporter ATP-binding protein AztA n=1 Tax=Microbacterium thalli TaxID=3027921 RepID=UPI0023653795|nr:zinc ABC transporter ATP-binding protein AztA [Microbacterium thalli]MDD7928920.1 zinc ABC transporter ATP-binding protein AztA [Microbacterium thalli]